MANTENSPYPNWDAQYDSVSDQTEREIEEWYKRNADVAGHATVAASEEGLSYPPAGGSWFERAEEEAKVLYQDVKAKLKDLFTDTGQDAAVRAEHEQAWNDDAHWQGRIRASGEKLEQEGRFGQNTK